MQKIDPALEADARANPSALFQIILRIQGDMDAHQAELETEGFVIARRMWLIQGFAGTAPGTAITLWATYDWIVSIEPDRTVQTM